MMMTRRGGGQDEEEGVALMQTTSGEEDAAFMQPSVGNLAIKLRVAKAVIRRFQYKFLEGVCCGYPSPLPPPDCRSSFASLDEAAASVRDGDVLALAGLAGHLNATGFFFSLVRRFKHTGHPRGLTVVTHGGNGGRGRFPGTIDDVLALPGCVTRLIAAHIDTHAFAKRRMLDDDEPLEVHILPLGVMSLLYASIANSGTASLATGTGVGTFLDPRVGRGSLLTPSLAGRMAGRRPSFVEAEGPEEGPSLRYSLPTLTVACLCAAACDRGGNVYSGRMSMVSDVVELARAVRRSGGTVVVTVGLLVPAGWGDVLLTADEVDAVVLDPLAEQCVGATYASPWPFLSLRSSWPPAEARRVIDVVNTTLKLTPSRAAKDRLLARLAALYFCGYVSPGARFNIGTGLPEEVGAALGPVAGLLEPYNEGGALGGTSAAGIFFGGAICPRELVSPAEVYRRLSERLDCVVLGGLEVDERGDVNVSSRGREALHAYVGPGGFVDLWHSASLVIFCVAFETGAKLTVDAATGRVRVARRGAPKFVPRVAEVCFSGARALAMGKRVLYVTHLGAFVLVEGGVQLAAVFPGVDVRRDILDASPMKILLPSGGVSAVQTVGGAVLREGEAERYRAELEAALHAPVCGEISWACGEACG